MSLFGIRKKDINLEDDDEDTFPGTRSEDYDHQETEIDQDDLTEAANALGIESVDSDEDNDEDGNIKVYGDDDIDPEIKKQLDALDRSTSQEQEESDYESHNDMDVEKEVEDEVPSNDEMDPIHDQELVNDWNKPQYQVELFFADLFINDIVPLFPNDLKRAKDYMLYLISHTSAFDSDQVDKFLRIAQAENFDMETLRKQEVIVLNKGGALDVHRDYFSEKSLYLSKAVVDFEYDETGHHNWSYVHEQEYYRELMEAEHSSRGKIEKTHPAYYDAITRFMDAMIKGQIDIAVHSGYVDDVQRLDSQFSNNLNEN